MVAPHFSEIIDKVCKILAANVVNCAPDGVGNSIPQIVVDIRGKVDNAIGVTWSQFAKRFAHDCHHLRWIEPQTPIIGDQHQTSRIGFAEELLRRTDLLVGFINRFND